jgi:hypothetical protein
VLGGATHFVPVGRKTREFGGWHVAGTHWPVASSTCPVGHTHCPAVVHVLPPVHTIVGLLANVAVTHCYF